MLTGEAECRRNRLAEPRAAPAWLAWGCGVNLEQDDLI